MGGSRPGYAFTDPELAADYRRISDHYAGSTLTLVGATRDQQRYVYLVSGNAGAEDYVVYAPDLDLIQRVTTGYPDVTREDIQPIEAWQYEARDGTSIPAVVTWPGTPRSAKGLPLVVMPHGGPASHDTVRFDWWAQFVAQMGYVVLQPNFRGSTGYGVAFEAAGHGEWGRLMQDDVSDGVRALVDQGFVDAKRVCIMGASYGGYAALAGGAYTPELYRCVISVGGVSDLPGMLKDERYYGGRDSWAYAYWTEVIGDGRLKFTDLKSISPYYAAEQFEAPVLLIHGEDDTIVLPRQSKRMHKALKEEKKASNFEEMDDQDHWFTTGESRRQVLQEITRFLRKHNPPGPVKTLAEAAPRAARD